MTMTMDTVQQDGPYQAVLADLRAHPRKWLVTGTAGFIGSNVLETLLNLGQEVVGLDNFATGSMLNLKHVEEAVGEERYRRFRFIEADIGRYEACREACDGVAFVIHLAARGSVPFSLGQPLEVHRANVTGFCNMICAAKDSRVNRFVYASSSAVYGDHPGLPKVESEIGRSLSPYATTKRANELYADVYCRCYGIETIGLRYFNVFGPRQNPDGPYAAVIPRWIQAMIRNGPVFINGDGETSRDFCYVANVVQANLLAALTGNPDALNQVYNVAVGASTRLNELFGMLRERLLPRCPHLIDSKPVYREFRSGDVRHSHADISKARGLLGYSSTHRIEQGLDEALEWYVANLSSAGDAGPAKMPGTLPK
ncbi:MAG: SDR family oxidoreductase [Verrucomicrobia bacterium]|nr:SDR family oxidoreductase [Verrucomicrobiota bacterium]